MILQCNFPSPMTVASALCLALAFGCPLAAEQNLPIVAEALPVATGGAGLGIVMRSETSPYLGGGRRNDVLPLYIYSGKRAFIEADRVGVKLHESPDSRVDVFLGYRFEGYPYDRIPVSLAGMAHRSPGLDLGLAYQQRNSWGTVFGELLHDAATGSNGTEVRAGYRYDWKVGNLQLQPQFTLAARGRNLNNYYYGVRASEATATRPAYEPGAGLNTEIGLSAVYRLSERWRVLAGISAKHLASGIRGSPIVRDRTQLAGQLGLAYDFSPEHDAWPEGRPLIIKLMHGRSTDCDFAKVMLLRCFSIDTVDMTRISAVEIGRPFIERVNGWPLDFVGYLGAVHHDERGFQDNSWELNAYMKAYYYGFPWSNQLRTRLGLGVGASYAARVPFVEMRDQLARGRSSSKLLNYLNLSADFSLGDLIGARSLRDTYLGLGVSHRSGIFGSSRLLGNVNGGSNYIYTYLDWRM